LILKILTNTIHKQSYKVLERVELRDSQIVGQIFCAFGHALEDAFLVLNSKKFG